MLSTFASESTATEESSAVDSAEGIDATFAVSAGIVTFASSPCKFGISPSNVKPAFIKAPTISIIEMPFILAPLGMVIILPTEWSITLLVISVNPNPFMIFITSGYSCTKS